jgi:acyl-coenzyme A synthetase/AMP-(fatty) acid ligase
MSMGRPADHIIALSGGRPIAFDRFAAEVAGASVRLRRAGCTRVALLCQDSYRFAVGLFATLHAGGTAVLPPNGQPATLAALCDTFDLLLDDRFLRDTPAALPEFDMLAPAPSVLEFFTSGSTGTPKRILKNLRVLEREVATLDELWATEMGTGPVVATVSHQHIYGLTFKLLWPLASGRPFAAEMHQLWETLLDRLPVHAVLIASPAHLGRLSGIGKLASERRPRGVFSAGAPLSFAAAQETAAILGTIPTEIFGSTETGAIATRRQTSQDQPWRTLPGVAVAADDLGRLTLRSPFLDHGDWVETSDLIDLANDGFHLRGRADRIVKIEGKRISLPEIEAALAANPWVEAAGIVLVPGPFARLGAVVVPNAAGRGMLDRAGSFRFGRLLRRALAESHEPAGLPRLWRFRDRLPAGPMGKCRDIDILALFDVSP